MINIERPIAIRLECRQVDADNDLWDMHYEEDVPEGFDEEIERTVQALATIIPSARRDGNTIIVDMKRVMRHVAFDAIAGEMVMQSSIADYTIGDVLGGVIFHGIKVDPAGVATYYEPQGTRKDGNVTCVKCGNKMDMPLEAFEDLPVCGACGATINYGPGAPK